MQDVLQADWQDAWHSPQPPVWTELCKEGLLTVLMCFILHALLIVQKIRSFYIVAVFSLMCKYPHFTHKKTPLPILLASK